MFVGNKWEPHFKASHALLHRLDWQPFPTALELVGRFELEGRSQAPAQGESPIIDYSYSLPLITLVVYLVANQTIF